MSTVAWCLALAIACNMLTLALYVSKAMTLQGVKRALALATEERDRWKRETMTFEQQWRGVGGGGGGPSITRIER